jgi:hypothetical protein
VNFIGSHLYLEFVGEPIVVHKKPRYKCEPLKFRKAARYKCEPLKFRKAFRYNCEPLKFTKNLDTNMNHCSSGHLYLDFW